MHWQFDGYNYLLRLDKGEQLMARLTEFVDSKNIQGGWISGVGAVSRVELGFYHLEMKEYNWRALDALLEIVSLNGTVAWNNGQAALHLHGVFSDSNMQTQGGHVKEALVAGTCEIFIHVWNKDRLSRSHSDEVGLNLLDL